MAIPIGHDASFSFQKEAPGYGTIDIDSVSSSRMLSESMTHTVHPVARESQVLTQYYDSFGMHHVGGNTTFEVQYAGQEELFYSIFGTYAFADLTVDTHTFTAVGNVPDARGLTIEIAKDLTDAAEQFGGCKCASATFTLGNAGFLVCSADWLGTQWDLDTATAVATYDTSLAIHWSHFDANTAKVMLGTVSSYKIRDLSFTVNNNLQETYNLEGIGNRISWPAEPSHSDRQVVTGNFTMVYDSKVLTTYIESASATANNNMLFEFDDPSSANYATITFDNCHINASQPVSSGGEILQTIEFQAFGDISTAMVTFKLGNASADIT